MSNNYSTVLLVIIIPLISVLILMKPFVGIILTLVSLPLLDLLPDVPLVSSIVIPIGAATIAGYLFSQKGQKKQNLLAWNKLFIVSFFFVIWVFISNPRAAIFGEARNWAFTLLQCWVLLWLSSKLLDTAAKQRSFMWIFSFVCVISALFSISQGQIGTSISDSIRAGGLADQPNITARYLVVAFIFLTYLLSLPQKWFIKALTLFGIVVTFVGVFFTLSRTGIIMLAVAGGLLFLTSERKKSVVLIIVYVISALLLVSFSADIFKILESIIPSITQGGNTIGLRYSLWRAGWRMWLDNPIAGVGIGKFSENLPIYAQDLPPFRRSLVAHNTYVSVLAETGFVGILLLLFMIFFSLQNYIVPNKALSVDITALRKAWIIAFISILIGSTTKNDHYDKFFWFIMGISVFFQNQVGVPKNKKDNSRLASPSGSNFMNHRVFLIKRK